VTTWGTFFLTGPKEVIPEIEYAFPVSFIRYISLLTDSLVSYTPIHGTQFYLNSGLYKARGGPLGFIVRSSRKL